MIPPDVEQELLKASRDVMSKLSDAIQRESPTNAAHISVCLEALSRLSLMSSQGKLQKSTEQDAQKLKTLLMNLPTLIPIPLDEFSKINGELIDMTNKISTL